MGSGYDQVSQDDQSRALYQRAQRFLVGALLADGTQMNRVLELITEDDIEEPSLALVFRSQAMLSRKNMNISVITVAKELEDQGRLAEAGGPTALYTLAREGGRYLLEAPPEIFAKIVKEGSSKAKVHRILAESLDNFRDDSGVYAADAVSDVQSFLNEQLLTLSDSSTISHFSDGHVDYLEMLEERRLTREKNASNSGIQGIPSLLPTLDKYTGGWKSGQLITVGAGTGVGKSVFAINCALAAATAGVSVMMFSLEMSRDQIEDRVVSSATGVKLNHLKSGDVREEDMSILREFGEERAGMKLTIDVEPKITVDGIRARALRQAQSREGLDLLIVDYLQLITPVGRFSSRQEAVADISRNLKLLAKQLGIPIIVLVQLKRKDNKDDGGEGSNLPEIDDIRESAAIAHDSDVVLFLHRDPTPDGSLPHTLVLLRKNRDGENEKMIRCHSNLECSLFREVTRAKNAEGLGVDDDDSGNSGDALFGEPDDAMGGVTGTDSPVDALSAEDDVDLSDFDDAEELNQFDDPEGDLTGFDDLELDSF